MNALPLPLSAPGLASVFPEESTMVISSSGNVKTTPDFESAFTVALLLRGRIDIATLQTLARRTDITELTAGYVLVVAAAVARPSAAEA